MTDRFLAEDSSGNLFIEDDPSQIARMLDEEAGFKFWYLKPTSSGYVLKRVTARASEKTLKKRVVTIAADGIFRGSRES